MAADHTFAPALIIQSKRYHKATGKTERETRYCISNLQPGTQWLNTTIRQHWGIENKLHWVLDVAFSEDLSRKRAGYAAQNFFLHNRIALNLLKQNKTSWDYDHLFHLLGVTPHKPD